MRSITALVSISVMTALCLLLCPCFVLAQTPQASVGLPPTTNLQPAYQPSAEIFGTVSGARAIACITNSTPPKAIYFNTNSPGSLQVVDSLTEFITGAVFVDGKYYALPFYSKGLFVVDTANGSKTLIDTLDVPDGGSWTGMTYDPTTGTTYGVSTTISSSTLYRIDLQNGTATVVAPIGQPAIITIAISSGGQMYAVDIVKDSLFAIDKKTGASRGIGPIGFDANFAQDMCFDYSTGILYYAASNGTLSRGELRTVDLTTGATTLIAPFQNNSMVDGLVLLSQTPSWAKRCALVYDGTSSDSTSARIFSTFLNANGFSTTRIPITAVTTMDFKPFQAILISSGSGYTSAWGTTQAVAALQSSNKPIIGIGEGGYAFFGKLGLCIGYPNGSHGSDTTIKVLQPTRSLFLGPNDVTLQTDSTCRLFRSPSPSVTPSPGNPQPTSFVNLAGIMPYTFDAALAQDTTRYLLWAFGGVPDSMTVDGQHLFLNAVVYMVEQYVTGRVAYITGADHSALASFEALFAANGLSTSFIDTSAAGAFDFGPFNVIVVDARSGDWANAARWGHVASAGKPIVGIHEAGLRLFERMGLWISFPQSMGTSGSGIYLPDLSLPVLNGPASIAVEQDSTSMLYFGGSDAYALYTGGGVASDVKLIGRLESENGYYPIASQGSNYFWGFRGAPDVMTPSGKNLFMNIVFAAEKSVIMAVDQSAPTTPEQFTLAQNYPNPFNPVTQINYTIGQKKEWESGRVGEGGRSVNVQLIVYDILGRQVATLVNEAQRPGRYQVQFNASNLASGVYFCRLMSGSFQATTKMMLMK